MYFQNSTIIHLFIVVHIATFGVTMPFLNYLLACSQAVRLVSGLCYCQQAAI